MDARLVDAAERRADLLVKLCGRNVLISQDRLFAQELRRAHKLTDSPVEPFSSTGDWFPEGSAAVSPIGEVELTKGIVDVIAEVAPNRAARRLAARKALKRGKPRSDLLSSVVGNARSGTLDEILAKYPMRPTDARVLTRYSVGDATAEEAEQAFLESLRDPRWMMQWYRAHHSKLTPFIEWTRGPGRTLLQSLDEMAEQLALLRKFDLILGTSAADEVMSSAKWKTMQDELLVRLASRLTQVLLGHDASPLGVDRIDEMCPGLSVGVRTLHSAWWTTTLATPRRAKPSDFPDALHAMYAPYVDLFRADAFMAPHITPNVSRFGTTVVPKLSGLLLLLQAHVDADR
ncbi:hypothetical protein [Aquabacterium sp. J223]|uniref:hypothetical protein n=1 Tax=Aquabacterium sp. J223 TaxID=2898431 RepID=UPI0021AE1ED3|nr:hypothetical protein [Aquabacterium sp. J223]UUX95389.1 hypothetical protein LRS07_19600 [Aquabacterium sp. J223]